MTKGRAGSSPGPFVCGSANAGNGRDIRPVLTKDPGEKSLPNVLSCIFSRPCPLKIPATLPG
ncbi:hypothetical protein P421_09365 [Heyndrickxia coagulans P38]|nr:hypothetical protein P421_09365 [Heyndrickxia coagulans P38]